MPATSIQSPFPIFTDIDGQPLEQGQVWLGTAGNNPISSPITAYWDAALTQVVTQPVTTRGGYPMNGSAVGRLYVNSDFSILVRNRSGYDVLSALSATERFDSSLVTFVQAGAGAVVRTAQSKLRDVVSVKDFGAVGDGVTDDTAAIQAAAATGVALYFPRPAAFYRITASITLSAPITAGLYKIFGGTGSVTFSLGSVEEVYPEWWGIDGVDDHTEINKALLAFNTVALTQKYTVGSTGPLVVMNAGNKLIGKNNAEIYSAAVPNNVANVYVVDIPAGAHECEVTGINFRGNGSTAAGVNYPSAIRVYKANYADIHNNTFDGISWGVFVAADDAVNNNPIGTKVVNNIFYNMTGPVADRGGYGVLLTFNTGSLVSGNTFEGTSRHCIYLSAATRNAVVSGNICKGSEFSPISIFAGNVAGVEIYNCVVSNNRFICGGTALANSHGIPITGEVTDCIFEGNIVTGARDYGIFMQAASAARYPKRNKFASNVVTSSQMWGISCIDCTDCTFVGNTIYNNNLLGGIYETFFGESLVSASGGHLICDNDISIGQPAVRYSVYIGAGCDNVQVYDNKLSAGTFGILEDVSATAKIGMANPGVQTVAYAASVSIDPTLGEVVNITLTGNIVISLSSTKVCKGQKITVRTLQDGTGGRTVAFSSAFKHNWSDTGNTAGKVQAISFVCQDGVSFVQTGAITGYYTP
jgi:hypothetical protein